MKYLSFVTHFAAAIIITGIFLVIYATVQQSYRTAANDPQIQIARDLSNALSKGKSIKQLLPADTIDIAQSLAVFAEIFNADGKPVQSTGYLNGQFPQPPSGVFEFTNANMEDAITWQPQNNARMAMVFEKIPAPGTGYVAAGRSLKETEVRESNLLKMIGIAWIACMVVLFVHLLINFYLSKNNKTAA